MDAGMITVLLMAGSLVYLAFPKNITPEASEVQANVTGEFKQMKQNEASQLNVEIIKEGAGSPATAGQTLFVHYIGKLDDGTIFDSNMDGEPFAFTLGNEDVIAGWEIGLLGMQEGERRRLTIPPQLAYGDKGFAGVVPPRATLIFDVSLVRIQ